MYRLTMFQSTYAVMMLNKEEIVYVIKLLNIQQNDITLQVVCIIKVN